MLVLAVTSMWCAWQLTRRVIVGCIALIAAAGLLSGCGGRQSAIDVPIPDTGSQAETDDQLPESNPFDASLNSFFGEREPGAAPEPQTARPEDPFATTAEVSGGGAPLESAATDGEVAESVPDRATATSNTPVEATTGSVTNALEGPTLESQPTSVLRAATHDLTITGAGLVPGGELIVVGCQLPGEPTDPSMSAEDLAPRVGAINPAEDCAFAELVKPIVDEAGGFEISFGVEVGPATIVLAGPSSGEGEAVFTPVYLEQAS